MTERTENADFRRNSRFSQIHPFSWKFQHLEGAGNHRLGLRHPGPSPLAQPLVFTLANYHGGQKDYLPNLYSSRIILGNSICVLRVRQRTSGATNRRESSGGMEWLGVRNCIFRAQNFRISEPEIWQKFGKV